MSMVSRLVKFKCIVSGTELLTNGTIVSLRLHVLSLHMLKSSGFEF